MEEKALRKRQDIPDAYKWKLTDMYATDELWEKDVDVVYALAEEIAAYKGTLGTSAQRLLSYFEKMDELDEHLTRVYVYANESYHQDTADAKYQGYAAKADSVRVAAASSISFAEPEILAISEDDLNRFYTEEPKLEMYRRKIEVIQREKEHTLSAAEENILAHHQSSLS